jgi:hypothetical protein
LALLSHVRIVKMIGSDTSVRDQFAAELEYLSQCIIDDQDPGPAGQEGFADVRKDLPWWGTTGAANVDARPASIDFWVPNE